ncbi:MAG: CYTH domain-containing protein [Oscillatoria sp. PMC 1068.18]|nr:CYTH domain-containing protein [Oscillatoria sp. PMC 1076.18]MEC4991164.1 CYTH domain-containing protein [Oscillatoria sp. PMC 1068.18]
MPLEIERKFLVKNDDWRKLATGTIYRQGYLTRTPEKTVRIRVVGKQGYLTIKGKSSGNSRPEFEYSIPVEDAEEMLANLCEKPLIEKTRYKLNQGELIWEIDEFAGENQGLIIAEVELENENQVIELPGWLGEEVTDDPRYYNANLVSNPYCNW